MSIYDNNEIKLYNKKSSNNNLAKNAYKKWKNKKYFDENTIYIKKFDINDYIDKKIFFNTEYYEMIKLKNINDKLYDKYYDKYYIMLINNNKIYYILYNNIFLLLINFNK